MPNLTKEQRAELRKRYESDPRRWDRASPMEWLTMAAEILVLLDALDAAEAVIEKLPLTADGVPVVPRMRLYPLHPITCGGVFRPDEDYCEVRYAAKDNMGDEDIDDFDPHLNYSSPSSARAAANEKEQS
ncbi:MAG TPA: hypothetical protein VHQ47_08965 [Phycisphaerae bacterium]|jgi:hypothetical protein|nr:hypothetical protein [Phycisphaerae bacterium]